MAFSPGRPDPLELPHDSRRPGVSPATVQRIWDARPLKPHGVETFKLSNDPKFEDKLVDIVWLYLNPLDKVVVLCMDEKSRIQALDRTQSSLPMGKGRAGTITHHDKRNGNHDAVCCLGRRDQEGLRTAPARASARRVLGRPAHHRRQRAQGLAIHLILDNWPCRGRVTWGVE